MTDEDVAECPKCGSTSIQAVSVNKSDPLKAFLTADLTGSTAAGIAAGSGSAIRVVCLKCGCQWDPANAEAQRRLKALSGRAGAAAKIRELEAIQEEESEASGNRLRILAVIVVIGLVCLFLVYITNN